MNDLKSVFKENKHVNIGYIVGGYPTLAYTKDLLKKIDQSPIDILEIGIPYSDPLADGKTIATASFETAQKGINVDTIFDLLIHDKKNIKIPLVFLVYYNVIFAYGIEKFIQKMVEANIQGIIVPDLPYEEAQEFINKITMYNISFIPLMSVTSENRISQLVSQASTFIYAIGALGVTGTKQVSINRLQKFIEKIKKQTTLPIAIGFGIKTNQDIKELRMISDGVIVGTTIVELTKMYSTQDVLKQLENLFEK